MGNQDNWTTPKQIKIEREGEPRGTRRGKLRKGERRKGKKARVDELLAAKKVAEQYRQYVHNDEKRRIAHPEWYTPEPEARLRRYDPEYKKWFAEAATKLKKLVDTTIKDGMITVEEAKDWVVELYPL